VGWSFLILNLGDVFSQSFTELPNYKKSCVQKKKCPSHFTFRYFCYPMEEQPAVLLLALYTGRVGFAATHDLQPRFATPSLCAHLYIPTLATPPLQPRLCNPTFVCPRPRVAIYAWLGRLHKSRFTGGLTRLLFWPLCCGYVSCGMVRFQTIQQPIAADRLEAFCSSSWFMPRLRSVYRTLTLTHARSHTFSLSLSHAHTLTHTHTHTRARTRAHTLKSPWFKDRACQIECVASQSYMNVECDSKRD
jgi:hypothetical protein